MDIWGVVSTTLLIFTLVITYAVGHRIGTKKGFKRGADKVLGEWKNWLNEGDAE